MSFTRMLGSILDNPFLCISYIKAHFYFHLEYSNSSVTREILCMATETEKQPLWDNQRELLFYFCN